MYINGWNKEKVMAQIRLRNNGSQAYENASCKYRTNDNNACLVGCFIPDDKYEARMEGGANDAISIINNFDLGEFMPFKTKLMDTLQYFHDNHLNHVEAGEDFYNAIEKKLIEIELDTVS